MPYSCAAYGCTQRWIKGGEITFHGFPTNDIRRRAWEIQLRRENFKATKYTKICSKHFTEDCFDKNKFGGTWLKPDALPTIFNFPDHMKIQVTEPIPVPQMSTQNEEVDDEDIPGSSGFLFERRKRLYFIGDFNEEDVETPENAKKFFQIAQKEKSSFNMRMNKLHRRNDYLKTKISKLEKLLDGLGQKMFMTDTASSVLGGPNAVVEEEKDLSSQEGQDNIPVAPAIRIKEEPADDYSTPSTSSGTSNGGFILPHTDIPWTTTRPVVESQITLSVASLNSPNVPQASVGEPLKKKPRTDSPNITIASASTLVSVSTLGPASVSTIGPASTLGAASLPSTGPASTLASLSTFPSNHTGVNPQSQALNFENISTPGSFKEHQKHQFDSFGNYVASKLNSLDPISSSCAQKDITNIILQAEMGKYLNQTQDIKPAFVP